MSSSDDDPKVMPSGFDFVLRAKPQIEVILGGVAGIVSGAFGIAALYGEYRRLHPRKRVASPREPTKQQANGQSPGSRQRPHVPPLRADTR